MRKNKEVTLERIEDSMVKCAALIDQYGDSLMPILERLEREWHARRQPSATDRVKKLIAAAREEAGRD